MRGPALLLLAWVVAPLAAAVGALTTWPTSFVGAAAWLSLAFLPGLCFSLWTTRRGATSAPPRPVSLSLFALAAVLATATVVLVGRYYAFYYLDTPGTGAGLLFGVLPVLYVLMAGTAHLLFRLLRGRGASVRLATGAAALGAVAWSAVAITHTLVTTSAARSAEGVGAGDLGPFLRALLP